MPIADCRCVFVSSVNTRTATVYEYTDSLAKLRVGIRHSRNNAVLGMDHILVGCNYPST